MAQTTTSSGATASVAVPKNDNRIIWLLLGAAFVAMLNETTMGVAIPHLIHDLDITAVQAQWLTTAFMLTMAVVIPITGFLLRRFTTRMMFIAAMSLFTAGTLIALLAPGFPVLVAARVVQASGTAIMMPLLMTTMMTVVAPEARGRVMGRVSIVMALAPAIGPSVSGLVLDNLNWRWIFGLILPIAIIALLVGVRWIKNLGTTEKAPIDVLSVILSAFGFGGIVFGLSQIGSHGGGSGGGGDLPMVIALSVGAIALGSMIWRQLILQRRDAALLDLRVFRSVNFSLSVVQLGVMAMAFFGALTLLPLFMQNVLKLSALESGLIVLPGSLVMGLLGPVIGLVYDKYGTRVLLVPGAVIVSACLWTYATLGVTTPVWFLVAVQTALSVGLALSFTPLFTASLGSLAPKFYSYGSAVVATVQQVAGAAGVALLITIMSGVQAGAAAAGEDVIAAGADGARTAFMIAAIISMPLILGAFFIRKPANDQTGAGVVAAH